MGDSITNELYLEIQHAKKHKVADLIGFIKGYILTGIMCGRYSWFLLTGTNVEIKMAMDDFDKSKEYDELYQEYKDKNNKNVMGYWEMTDIAEFLAKLAIKNITILKKIN